jgi:hypothetical protein
MWRVTLSIGMPIATLYQLAGKRCVRWFYLLVHIYLASITSAIALVFSGCLI